MIGEFHVNFILSKMLDKNKYIVMNDILLPTEDGSTQIDHVVLSEFGIFVIETKNIAHWIISNIGPYWTQIIYKKQYKFQNPTRQNYKHIKTLEKVVGIDEKEMMNVVVFTGDCTFKTDVPKGVLKTKDIIKYIESYDQKIIERKIIDNYINNIEKNKIKNSIKSRINHILHVEKIKREKGNAKFASSRNGNKFSTNFRLNIIFIIILMLIILGISSNSKNNFPEIIKKNKENIAKINKKIVNKTENIDNIQINEKQIIVNPIKTNPYITQKIETRIEKPQKYKGVIYSWKNERGQKTFSNKGFPKDGKYTEGKLEWY
ncbi:MAG: nuclease-related domain-containing protein [Prolixibacteraceae bacterium]|nr:nuclease-related domain-containing protein [Prolixibacteraceae bacterium]